MKRFIVLALAAASALPIAPASAGPVSIPYLPSNDGYNLCDKEPFPPEVGPANPTKLNLGAVCPVITYGKKVRILDVADSLSADVSFSWWWLDKDFGFLDNAKLTEDPIANLTEGTNHSGGGCNSTSWIPAPRRAKFLYVFLHGAALNAGIGNCDPGAFASQGVVKLQIARV